MKHRGWEETLYRILLRLYPRRFREEHGDDALELFRDRLAEARRTGRRGRFLTRAMADVLLQGALERVTDLASWQPTGDSALRRLARHPGHTALIVGVLALGVGGCATMVTLLRTAVLAPLPFPEPDRLIRVWERNTGLDLARQPPSPGNFVDWEEGLRDIATLTAWHTTTRTFRSAATAEELRTTTATDGFFDVLGTPASAGRAFERGEVDRNGPGVVLSDGAWTRVFGADPAVVGTRIELNGELHTVLGVMPPGFAYPDASVDIWTTWHMATSFSGQSEVPRGWRFASVAGRLAPGVAIDDVRTRLARLQDALARSHPQDNAGWSATVEEFDRAERGAVARPLWMAMGAAALILLVATVDIGMILLARVPLRRQEMAVRVSMGAGRRALVGLLGREAALVAVLGGTAGLALAMALLWAARGLIAPIPGATGASVDPTTAGFALLVAAGATAVFTIVPALASLRVAPASVLRSSDGRTSGGPRRLGDGFVVVQTCAAVVLLGTSAAVATDLRAVLDRDPGFDPAGLATFRISLTSRPGPGPAATSDYYRSVLEAVRAEPDVVRASAVQTFPLHPVSNDPARPYRLPGSGTPSAEAPMAQVRIVAGEYFATMGTPLLAGEGFSGDEAPGGPGVVVVSEATARDLWPSGPVVGQTVEIDFQGGWRPYRVVGVVPGTRHYGLQEAVRAEVYLPHAQIPYLPMNVVVRLDGSAPDVGSRMERIVRSIAPGQPIHGFARAEDLVADSWGRERLLLAALGLFALLALVLTVAGVYGVTALSVAQRRQEVGIRIALGARPGQVRGMVLGRAVGLALAGTVLGGLGAWAAAGAAARMLPDAPEASPWVVPAAGVAMLLAAVVAASLPARRAARTTGVALLRE